MKRIIDYLLLLLGVRTDFRDEMVDAGLIDHSGQGRDKYGT